MLFTIVYGTNVIYCLHYYMFIVIKINCTIGNNDLSLCQYNFLYYICENGQFGSNFLYKTYILVMRDRILAVMDHEGLTPSRFAEAIGIQRSAMSHIISGRNNPSLDVLLKILERFTYIDSDWLLFGKGNMMREHVLTNPDLFTNTTINPPTAQDSSEYRKEMKVETPVNTHKQPVIEQIILPEKSSRNVSKIMIFYSDNTFETFTPEKNKKD